MLCRWLRRLHFAQITEIKKTHILTILHSARNLGVYGTENMYRMPLQKCQRFAK